MRGNAKQTRRANKLFCDYQKEALQNAFLRRYSLKVSLFFFFSCPCVGTHFRLSKQRPIDSRWAILLPCETRQLTNIIHIAKGRMLANYFSQNCTLIMCGWSASFEHDFSGCAIQGINICEPADIILWLEQCLVRCWNKWYGTIWQGSGMCQRSARPHHGTRLRHKPRRRIQRDTYSSIYGATEYECKSFHVHFSFFLNFLSLILSSQYHTDDEKGLQPIVSSLSLGSMAQMHFRLREKYRREEQMEEHNSRELTLVLRHVRF